MPTLRAASAPKTSAMPMPKARPTSDADPGVPAEVQALAVRRGGVAEREAGDAVDRDLGERDHAAVGVQERQARRDDAEQQDLGEQGADPVAC